MASLNAQVVPTTGMLVKPIPSIASLPNATSSDYDAMADYWLMIEAIIGGTAAMHKADIGGRYLPKFPNEELTDYKYRLANSVFTNIYGDIVGNLASKPFAEELQLVEPVASPYDTLAKDIDGRGNSLHVFAQETFYWGINLAIDWILVDYPKVQYNQEGQKILTISDEQRLGLRPYWVHVTAPRMLAVYADTIGGEEIFTHARISEVRKERFGFNELTIERVRVFDRQPVIDGDGQTVHYNPATFSLWEKRTQSGTSAQAVQWELVDEGNLSIGVIPIVPFITGKRIESSWQFLPPLRDCAYAQIEHFQQETGLKSIKELTAFPMLAGNGVYPPDPEKPQKLNIGARAVVYAPPISAESGRHGEWKFIEPAGTSLKFLADEINRLEKQMRELGKQPLTAQSGNLTVITTAFAAQKGNSACQQWALNLTDTLEQAWYLTSLWLNRAKQEVKVKVYTDFALESGEDTSPPLLKGMRDSGDLTQRTFWEEMRRRNILSPDFDADKEKKALDKEKADNMAISMENAQMAADAGFISPKGEFTPAPPVESPKAKTKAKPAQSAKGE